jgi:hypothetical protein
MDSMAFLTLSPAFIPMDSSDPRFSEVICDVQPNIIVTSDLSDSERAIEAVESMGLKG